MKDKFKQLDSKELKQVTGGIIDVKLLNELSAGICAFFDGFNKKKYRGKC